MAYQDEEAIKAQLRELTDATRKLRQELDGLVRSSEARDLTRGLLHVSGTVKPDTPIVAHERRRTQRKKR